MTLGVGVSGWLRREAGGLSTNWGMIGTGSLFANALRAVFLAF